MATWASLRQYVAPQVPGAPNPVLDEALRNAARALCQRSMLWKDEKETASLSNGRNTVDLDPDGCLDLISVQYMTYNGFEMVQTTERRLSSNFPRWREATGAPSHCIISIRDKEARLYPTPNKFEAMAIAWEAIVKPSRTATEIPDWIAEEYREVLRNGALKDLMAMGGNVPWANPQMAGYYAIEFDRGVYQARARVMQGYSSQDVEVQGEPLY